MTQGDIPRTFELAAEDVLLVVVVASVLASEAAVPLGECTGGDFAEDIDLRLLCNARSTDWLVMTIGDI